MTEMLLEQMLDLIDAEPDKRTLPPVAVMLDTLNAGPKPLGKPGKR